MPYIGYTLCTTNKFYSSFIKYNKVNFVLRNTKIAIEKGPRTLPNKFIP